MRPKRASARGFVGVVVSPRCLPVVQRWCGGSEREVKRQAGGPRVLLASRRQIRVATMETDGGETPPAGGLAPLQVQNAVQ